jgi:hypothetical protein
VAVALAEAARAAESAFPWNVSPDSRVHSGKSPMTELDHDETRATGGFGAREGLTLLAGFAVAALVLAMLALGVSVWLGQRKVEHARPKWTRINARELRIAAEIWRGAHAADECPTVERLRSDRAIDSAAKTTDAWDRPYTIRCLDDETIVASGGPDGRFGTQDDIVVAGPGSAAR